MAIREGRRSEVELIVSTLRRQSVRLQRLAGAAFYLFGIVLFLGLQSAYRTIENSTTPVGWIILQNFGIQFVFAFNVFFTFLILHLLGWFVATSTEKLGAQSDARQLH